MLLCLGAADWISVIFYLFLILILSINELKIYGLLNTCNTQFYEHKTLVILGQYEILYFRIRFFYTASFNWPITDHKSTSLKKGKLHFLFFYNLNSLCIVYLFLFFSCFYFSSPVKTWLNSLIFLTTTIAISYFFLKVLARITDSILVHFCQYFLGC